MDVSAHGGHTPEIQGANYGGRKEHVMDREVKDAFIRNLRALGHNVKDDTYEGGTSASQVVNTQIANINSRYNDVGFSFHLNASDGQGHGVEVLCYSEKEAPMAAKISAAIARKIGWKDRGAKIRPDIGVIRSTKCPVYLVECGFIDNDEDMAKWNAPAIADAVIEAYFGVASPEPEKPKEKGYRVVVGDFDDVIWFGKAYEIMKNRYGAQYHNWESVEWNDSAGKYIYQAKFGDFNNRVYAENFVADVKKNLNYGAWIIEL